MRIGKWNVRFIRWAIVIEPAWGTQPWDVTDDGRHRWVYAGSVVDLNKYYYSAEDIKRWKESLWLGRTYEEPKR
jgi:hypothetical protein